MLLAGVGMATSLFSAEEGGSRIYGMYISSIESEFSSFAVVDGTFRRGRKESRVCRESPDSASSLDFLLDAFFALLLGFGG